MSSPHPCDHRLKAYFIVELINSWGLDSISSGDTSASNALEHFQEFDDPDLKGMPSDDYLQIL
ncbi:hypothetical protein B0H13DRAFT_2395218 [Mycena leptocephala]|nr:hypothetical protein B0H13DRAFT_2395218 [Mycena leptocephala]